MYTTIVQVIAIICLILCLFLLFFRGERTSLRGAHPLKVRRSYGLLLDACGGDRAKVKRLIDLELQHSAIDFEAAVAAALKHVLIDGAPQTVHSDTDPIQSPQDRVAGTIQQHERG